MTNEMNKLTLNTNSIPQGEEINTINNKETRLELLLSGDYYIAFNEKEDIPIWNYLLSEDKTKIYIFDEEDQTIYDGLIIDAPDELFNHGDKFVKISFKGLNLEDNLVTKENFYLFKRQILGQKNGN